MRWASEELYELGYERQGNSRDSRHGDRGVRELVCGTDWARPLFTLSAEIFNPVLVAAVGHLSVSPKERRKVWMGGMVVVTLYVRLVGDTPGDRIGIAYLVVFLDRDFQVDLPSIDQVWSYS